MTGAVPAGLPGACRRTAVLRIALLSPYWGGNLGDGAILTATIDNLRRLHPKVEFVGITMSPQGLLDHHGIPGTSLVSFRRAYYSASAPNPPAAPEHLFHKLYRAARSLKNLLTAITGELLHFGRSLRLLRQTDILVVAGGGQLDDEWGGAWGHPYALCKWALAARLVRRPVAFLSVGVARLATPLSRWFVARALALSSITSFRDPWSQSFVEKALARPPDPVLPDLAFSLRLPAMESDEPSDNALTVGVSPIAYGRRIWPTRDDASSQRYLDVLARFVERVLRSGHEVVLFHTDSPDRKVVDLVAESVRPRLPDALASRLRVWRTDTLPALLMLLPTLHAVVASRLHGVILSHMHAIPTLAISYDRKVDTHMAQAGQEELCLQLRGLELDELEVRFAHLQAQRPLLRKKLSDQVARWREALQPQYERVVERAERTRTGE